MSIHVFDIRAEADDGEAGCRHHWQETQQDIILVSGALAGEK
jgi:hypothetical protein